MPRKKDIKIDTTAGAAVSLPQDFSIQNMFQYFNSHVQALNNSKVFAGFMIIILNIASKFVNIKLGKTLESYLKYTFSRQVLVFAITWMGTRDIYIALCITVIFVIFTEYLLHEDSSFFILSPEFRDYHISKMENMENISDDEIKKAKAILEKAEKQNNKEAANKEENTGGKGTAYGSGSGIITGAGTGT